MLSALPPENRTQSLAAPHDLCLFDSSLSPALDGLAKAAALACGASIALVTLIDADQIWFKATYGVARRPEIPNEHSFCADTILSRDILEVQDAREDPRFAGYTTVLGARAAIGFYAGAPLKLEDGRIAGALSVLGTAPARLNEGQREILKELANVASHVLEQQRSDLLLQETAEQLRMSQEFLQLTGQLAGVGGWAIDLTTLKLTWSPETFDIYGLPRGEPPDAHCAFGYFSDRSREEMNKLMASANRGEVFDFTLPFTRADGASRWIRTTGTVLREPGMPGRMVGACMDITHTHTLSKKLAAQHELLRVTLRSIGDGVITTDPAGIVNWMNPVAERLTGWGHDEAAGRALTEIFVIKNETTGETVENPILACLERKEVVLVSDNTVLYSRQSEVFGVEDSATPIRNEAGDIVGAVLIFRDVTQQRKLSSDMTYRATHDALTGLLNRGEFERRLSFLLQKAKVGRTESAILFIDLDQFKLVNDSCGHAAGDELLIQISKLLSAEIRASDCVARLGGDEFGILLDECPLADACQLAQRICDRMEKYRYMGVEQRFRVGASIGLAPVNGRWTDTSAVLQAADACCYAAKIGGRNRVHVWSGSDRKLNARHGEVQWAARLERALDEDQFVLFGQCIRSFDHGRHGLCAEVLLRMVDSDGSLLPPGAFLPAAERFHIASRIDRWVLSKALTWLNGLPDVEAVDMLSINVSGQSVGDQSFQSWTLDLLSGAGHRISERICIEITETAAVNNLVDASHFIERLKVIGVRVALDDFGAGASSFCYLKSMGVDFLKIDGQFVRGILTDKLDEATVRSFVEIANALGLRTIAEYTENSEVLARLQAIGVDYAQGYHIHRPIPLKELLISAALMPTAC